MNLNLLERVETALFGMQGLMMKNLGQIDGKEQEKIKPSLVKLKNIKNKAKALYDKSTVLFL